MSEEIVINASESVDPKGNPKISPVEEQVVPVQAEVSKFLFCGNEFASQEEAEKSYKEIRKAYQDLKASTAKVEPEVAQEVKKVEETKVDMAELERRAYEKGKNEALAKAASTPSVATSAAKPVEPTPPKPSDIIRDNFAKYGKITSDTLLNPAFLCDAEKRLLGL